MFFNGQNYAIQTVTSVLGQVVSFANGDSFNFNAMLAKATAGTLLATAERRGQRRAALIPRPLPRASRW